MPIYEYRRKDGSTFEIIQKFSDDALTHDPDSGEPVERVYTAPAIHFKGSGFHNTDYGSSRRPRAGSGESAGESASGDSGASSDSSSSGSDAKSDSKPATSEKSSGSETASGSTSAAKTSTDKSSGKSVAV